MVEATKVELALKASDIPEVLAVELRLGWQRLLERCDSRQQQWYAKALTGPWQGEMLKAFACSPGLLEYCTRFPNILMTLADDGTLWQPLPAESWRPTLDAACAEALTPEEFADRLRVFRHRHWVRIVWRDVNRLASMEETVADLSHLADAAIQAAVDFHHQRLVTEWGEPRSGDGEPQHLLVIGMGKLGACELNLSSDIDLIFTFPKGGETVGGRRSVSNQEFFIRLGQRVIKALDAPTAAGFVFRVDMRLRPYGQSGPLVISAEALEEYYQDQGRDWERYALIKARVVAGDAAAGAELMANLRPFVYRRYLDFSAFESLREMKSMIQREVQRRGLQDNIKLGSGGIREVEFIAQCFQLIRGGQETELQARGLLTILRQLQVSEYLPHQAVTELVEAYRFLRNTEHAIQAWRDQQTQQLPSAAEARAGLALAMGFADWAAFETELQRHREAVAEHFSRLIAPPEDQSQAHRDELQHWRAVLDEPEQEALQQALEAAEFEDAQEAARLLNALLNGSAVQRMQPSSKDRLDDFMPQLLEALREAQQPTVALLRIIPLIEAVLRRTAYLVLLMENPGALARLVQLCDASPWISRQLAANPVLLDELLDARSLFHLPEKAGLRSELRQRLLRIDEGDLEAQMEALRYYRLAHVLRVAASEVTGSLPLMKVSDYLTYIAEVVLEAVLDFAWQGLTEKHGHLTADGRRHFVIVAYGKLGGIELGYGSDLDLVFVHDMDANAVSDGERPVDSSTFFTRLGQRIIHILTAHTRLGDLYEVDMRLRPSGNSGLLVSSFKAFQEYQDKQAWTWEHQALVRARVVAGDEHLAAQFSRLRREVLSRPRDVPVLLAEVVSMREKMRGHLLPAGGAEKNAQFDLKQSPGGIVDIEFMVQYAVLAWAHQHPPLAEYTDNIRILESLNTEGLISSADAQALIDAYKAFRSQAHRLSLQEQKGRLASTALPEQRAAVMRLWQSLMESEN
ncbi:bifunctional [glutamate--ammonia ligase]-adenylyl-L-tyrosine phosphorylase/[glutamate--ammonia-ligase] adenylyltransferase [Spongiibacter taiwanensis]|uniref:bifunctional [glutamate--ammonia ligase]-adenylyl-L-tyrosine phosphorylase/[glutamate--ammonia-ligase] adenylyltransferase n=1 Tax=Spongiibacter taiwanensis TaxID=1748242 RepID=UPI00203550CE|nr:bifunctional [glutamate--ammonia ligase]-adenylyl-L-tyrosine phosphorylase/[glutamate--ammonia-ligase] adenylyltransferase [Spongiibacter taiwanensis]USA41605.1 bifunctional [glutamate--ammonia ligase]-adenylyl-L-tyrosine phosphorylase/[glutamate--ammonia-ligase] adenylyltransferase [Spongiibacter taiwanensis]